MSSELGLYGVDKGRQCYMWCFRYGTNSSGGRKVRRGGLQLVEGKGVVPLSPVHIDARAELYASIYSLFRNVLYYFTEHKLPQSTRTSLCNQKKQKFRAVLHLSTNSTFLPELPLCLSIICGNREHQSKGLIFQAFGSTNCIRGSLHAQMRIGLSDQGHYLSIKSGWNGLKDQNRYLLTVGDVLQQNMEYTHSSEFFPILNWECATTFLYLLRT